MSEQNSAPKKSKKGLIIATAGVALLVGAGGSYFAFAGKASDKPAAGEPVAEVKQPALFHELDPPFVVNFQPGSTARFLQVAVQLMTRDPQVVSFLEHHDPIIRNDLLLLFGNKQVGEVSTQEGKEALRTATLESVRHIIAAEGGKPESLEAVYFTSFVMQ